MHDYSITQIFIYYSFIANMIEVRDNYDLKAKENTNEFQRQQQRTFEIKAFNNWVKSVLINLYSKEMCKTLESIYDIRRGNNDKLLYVLDIGCGRGQDIKKWQLARVKYLVATDFSDECLKVFEERWRKKQAFHLYTTSADFTKRQLYNKICHSYYDIVSAQFTLHYMFGCKKNVENGMASILSNLLIGGVFISTIPDSYSILRKIKELGKQEGDSIVYGNKYFSMKFDKTNFTQPFGNQYGFYLEDAVGSKDSDGNILYTNEYLISLDDLEKIMNAQGAKIEETYNFLQFYKKYRDQYKTLFEKFKLIYREGEGMDADLWEICHLYRVLICRKVGQGMGFRQFGMKERVQAIKGKQIKRRSEFERNRNHNSYDRYHQKHHRRGSQ